MKVLSFNILCPTFYEGSYYRACPNVRGRKTTIVSTINNANADVVCLQEVLLKDGKVLDGDLDDKFHVFFAAHKAGYWCAPSDHGTAILLRKGTTSQIRFDALVSSEDGNVCSSVCFFSSGLQTFVYVINVHLECNLDIFRVLDVSSPEAKIRSQQWGKISSNHCSFHADDHLNLVVGETRGSRFHDDCFNANGCR